MHSGGGGVWQNNPTQHASAFGRAPQAQLKPLETTNGDEEGRISFGRNYYANKRKKNYRGQNHGKWHGSIAVIGPTPERCPLSTSTGPS